MASLESKSNASVGEVVVLAIGICMVVVIAITIVIYLTCFKNGPRFGGGVRSSSVNPPTGKDHKRKQKLKFGDDFKKRGTIRLVYILSINISSNYSFDNIIILIYLPAVYRQIK